MATFLLSISEHAVLSHALRLRTLARLKVDSSSPNRLTQWGPLTAITRQASTPFGRNPGLDGSEFESQGSLKDRLLPIIISTSRS